MAEVVTGEAVVLDLAVARFPSRMVALLIDGVIQFSALVFLLIVVLIKAARHLNAASAAAVFVAGYALVLVGYPVIFETLSRGRTLGKMALGLRVVSDDGGPIRFRQALIRGLFAAFLEVWVLGFVGLLASMFSARGKRLGDLVAGTFVIQERVPPRAELPYAMAMVPPPLAGWATTLEVSRLSDQTAAAASSYLRRYYELHPQSREQLGIQIATAVAAQVSPPPPAGTPAFAYLAAVLAVRRDREQARLAAFQTRQASFGSPAAQPFTPQIFPPPQPFAAPEPFAAIQPLPADQPTITQPAPASADLGPEPTDFGFAAPS